MAMSGDFRTQIACISPMLRMVIETDFKVTLTREVTPETDFFALTF